MARRVTWTNNSTSYDGTNIYRDTTIDPQNLPEPIATVDPVSQGATAEYIDLTGSGDQCYAVRDFDSSGDGALSEAYCFGEALQPPSIGEYWDGQGGYYAGLATYSDGREFHLIVAPATRDAARAWSTLTVEIFADDTWDGKANTDVMVSEGISDYPAGEFAVDTIIDGHQDFYLPATLENGFIYDNLGVEVTTVPAFQEGGEQAYQSNLYWGSEVSSGNASYRNMDTGTTGSISKTQTNRRIRPIRRVAA